MRTFIREMFHPTVDAQQIRELAGTKLYKLALGIYQMVSDENNRLLCGKVVTQFAAPDFPPSRAVYMVFTDGTPFLHLHIREDQYCVSLWNGLRYIPCCKSKTVGHLLNTLTKAKAGPVKVSKNKRESGFDVNYFWGYLRRHDPSRKIREAVLLGFDSRIANPDAALYATKSRMSEDALLWLMRILVGDVARTDVPHNTRVQSEISEMTNKVTKLIAVRESRIAGLKQYCSPHKWVVVRHPSESAIGGYSVGAYDCAAMFEEVFKRIADCGNAKSYADLTPLIPLTYYKTLDDLPDHIKPDLMSQLHMARISANATHPHIDYADDQLPRTVSTDASIEAGWSASLDNGSIWYVVDKAP